MVESIYEEKEHLQKSINIHFIPLKNKFQNYLKCFFENYTRKAIKSSLNLTMEKKKFIMLRINFIYKKHTERSIIKTHQPAARAAWRSVEAAARTQSAYGATASEASRSAYRFSHTPLSQRGFGAGAPIRPGTKARAQPVEAPPHP